MISKSRILFDQESKKYKDIQEQISKLYEEQCAAKDMADKAFINCLIDEKILGLHPWCLIIGENYFILECDVDSDKFKELSEFAEGNYHCSFELGDNFRLRFDDGEISISVKDVAQLQNFIEKFSIKFYLDPRIAKNKKELQNKLAEIEKWEKIFTTKV